MEDRAKPPLNEIVLSVAVAPQPALSGPLLADVLGAWFRSHPRVETAPTYEVPPESADFGGMSPGPGFQVVMAAQTEPRYWLVSEDEREVVQVQPNYLALNWRRRDMAQDYPGYEALRRRFLELLETADDGLKRHQGVLRPTRVEITYIDLIQPSEIWSSHADTHGIFNFILPSSLPYERLAFSFSQAITGPDGFAGRVHVTLRPNVDWMKQEPQLSLNITARSADLATQSIEAGLEFLDVAHERANEIFLKLLTQRARTFWGLK